MNMRFMSSKIRCFTLLETIVALFISSIGIILISGVISFLHHDFNIQSGAKERIRWEKTISTLESDSTQFRYVDNPKNSRLRLYSGVQQKNYEMYITSKGDLILRNLNNEGYMPLILGCSKYYFKYQEPILEFKIVLKNQHTYQQKIVMLRKKESEK